MEKIWVVTIEEVCEFESRYTSPSVFRKEEDARMYFEKMKAEFRSEYEVDFEGEWEQNIFETEQRTEVEIYSERSYASDHCIIRLSKVDLK